MYDKCRTSPHRAVCSYFRMHCTLSDKTLSRRPVIYLTLLKACCDCSIAANWMMALVLIFVYKSGKKWRRKVAAKRLHFLSLETWASFPPPQNFEDCHCLRMQAMRNVLFLYFVFCSCAFLCSTADISLPGVSEVVREEQLSDIPWIATHFNTLPHKHTHLSSSFCACSCLSVWSHLFSLSLRSSQTFVCRQKTAATMADCYWAMLYLSLPLEVSLLSTELLTMPQRTATVFIFTVVVCTQSHEKLKCDCPFSLLGTNELNFAKQARKNMTIMEKMEDDKDFVL